MDVYVLNNDLELIGIVNGYKSLIWSNRYDKIGECELYVEASTENFSLLREGYFLIRLDDDMVCRIKRIELDTNVESGNYLIVNGYDTKDILDQRIVWETETCKGSIEEFIRYLITTELINPSDASRMILKSDSSSLLQLGTAAGFTEGKAEQVSYQNLGEKIREYCNTYNWGYKVQLISSHLVFSLYKGVDRSREVIFSDKYENLSSTKYVEDGTKLGNVALVGGQGEGWKRRRQAYGIATGLNRYEQFVDAKDQADQMTYGELTRQYPNGLITAVQGEGCVYYIPQIRLPIMSAEHLAWLQSYHTGEEIDINGIAYYQTTFGEHIILADLPTISDPTETPKSKDNVILSDFMYYNDLISRAIDKLAEYKKTTSFEGVVIPNVTFTYKVDYNLGDVVKVRNEYGIEKNARIKEVTEVMDENGYKCNPTYEYIQEA
ncbi:MAG: siphovirus ReqiPepy6 Gp37-like family protein [Ruminococcus sp.]|nr:siphovirus ReqiPepy6 Gp37-like family protein [Ruminococcus sp.]